MEKNVMSFKEWKEWIESFPMPDPIDWEDAYKHYLQDPHLAAQGEQTEKPSKEFMALLDETSDFTDAKQMAQDCWLFLTNDKMPDEAVVKKEAFLHEVYCAIDLAVQAKQKAIEGEQTGKGKRIEAIAFNNWVSSRHKEGWPKKEDGSMMTCWELYDHFKTTKEYEAYIIHAKM